MWSGWIGPLFNSKGYHFSRLDLQKRKLAKWRRTTLDEKTKVVCSVCNNGWMSQLENRAKAAFSDMIRDGVKVCLLSRGLALLAAFTFKCAVVSDYARGDGDVFFPAFDRYRFRESLEIPRGTQMWIAAIHDRFGHRGADVHYRTSPTDTGFRDLNFYTYNFVAGHLSLQVRSTRWATLCKQGRDVPHVEPSTHWDAASVIEFWPNEYGFPIEWPPSVQIKSDLLQEFIYRWSGRINIMTG